jgi:DNA-binding IclR family transcriptional regulator
MADKRRGIRSIEIGFRVLARLESASRPLSLTEIALAADMSPSRVQFYLVSFLRVGVVAQDGRGGQYCLGPTAIRLGLAALAQMDVLEAARAAMADLRERTGDTVCVSVWGTHGPTVVNRLDGDKIAPMEVRVGAVVPLLTSATGKTCLAYLPRSTTAALLRREIAAQRRNGLSRIAGLDVERIIAEVKAHGIGRTTRGSVIMGFASIAAPVFDYEGALRCVITLTAPEGMIDMDYRSDTVRTLAESARSVSRSCGFAGEIRTAPRTRALAADSARQS